MSKIKKKSPFWLSTPKAAFPIPSPPCTMKSRSQSFFDKIGKYKVLRLFLVAVSFDEEQHGSDRWEDITLADLEVCTNTQTHKYTEGRRVLIDDKTEWESEAIAQCKVSRLTGVGRQGDSAFSWVGISINPAD